MQFSFSSASASNSPLPITPQALQIVCPAFRSSFPSLASRPLHIFSTWNPGKQDPAMPAQSQKVGNSGSLTTVDVPDINLSKLWIEPLRPGPGTRSVYAWRSVLVAGCISAPDCHPVTPPGKQFEGNRRGVTSLKTLCALWQNAFNISPVFYH